MTGKKSYGSLIESDVVHVSEEAPGFLRAVIDNPPVNLLGDSVIAGFRLLRDYAEANRTKVIVFESADPDFFFAHLDMSFDAENFLEDWSEFIDWLSTGSVISVAKIRGIMRGAVSSAFMHSCDMSFASIEKTRFTLHEMGFSTLPVGLEWLSKIVGRSRTLEICLSADDFDTKTAELYGWVNRAIADAELDEYVERFARRIASFDKIALATTKRLVSENSEVVSVEQLRQSYRHLVKTIDWPEPCGSRRSGEMALSKLIN